MEEASKVITSLPVSFDGENKYDEFDFWNEPVKINGGAILSEENKLLIANYMNVQKELERFYKEVNPIEHAGHNRDFDVLKKLVSMMNESDSDVEAIIRKYNEKLVQEEEKRKKWIEEQWLKREAREAGEYYGEDDGEDLGVSFLKGVAGIAIGTALGNKLSGNTGKSKGTSSRSGKRDFMGTAQCVYGKKIKMDGHLVVI